ncbi:hypothetical protein H2198_006519 [Neophaeococcomyces mojaviensis]|uniref:Uncharacterized protein n=1 Tax=Neophaeococcomyces mojaviensis TaxID=3383035 RepID=A0ACC3A2L5_9EURO|nr:hypothetical protein H2198_006519 [Knufia sp. JES_112]
MITGNNHLRQVLLEVERKFSRLRVYPLTINGGNPTFHSLKYLGTQTFCDTYFDHRSLLAHAGTWVRQRDGQWQSKIRQAGDYNNSQFREIQNVDEIGHQVHLITKKSQPSSKAFGLTQTAKITTHREAWKADDRFKIVLDHTDFGHVVGEVELEASVTIQSDEEAKKYCGLMDSEITSFMQRYCWAFDPNPAIGKLTAYFARRQSQELP